MSVIGSKPNSSCACLNFVFGGCGVEFGNVVGFCNFQREPEVAERTRCLAVRFVVRPFSAPLYLLCTALGASPKLVRGSPTCSVEFFCKLNFYAFVGILSDSFSKLCIYG
ncbi:hypothetical protein H5410_002866 [Solanum commersonii]|uniref:Uncharacterized protein n=1 Tax=Solanum commersonii TaxID=4109 RepID=A0A9J6B316_SOLCO|nr:hypothetical protein H5410_002866 [Solanum commersonii]